MNDQYPAHSQPVIVVGAGPAGCTAALLLADYGIPVTLLERYPEPHPLPRAVHLDDEVARTLGRIGVSEGFLARSRSCSGLRLLDAEHRVMAEFHREHQISANGFPQANMFHQPDLEWADTERVGFVLTNLIDALAPSNNPVLNPAAVKAVIDTGGRSAVTGLRHFAADMASPPRIPSMVEPDAFEVGVDLAVTPGAVVLRTPVFELIQYRPATQAVRQVPLLLVPPTINKFYVMDLAPGRSMVEYLVGRGLQVFMISWRNPDARHAKWDFDTYGQAVLDAMDAAARITGSEQAVLAGACSGGIIAAMVAAHLAHAGQQDRMAGLTLLVTVLDQGHAGLGSAVIDERNARLAAAASAARGYLDGRSLAEVFAWLRPNDLIWNYWVNNYLLGRTPPPFDILSWNADTTRMTAGLHRDFLQLGVSNALTRPGGAAMLGSPVDLAAIDRDSYQIAGITDHICPWQSCYRSAGLLGGNKRFVLSTSGHIAAMVNPPGNDKARYQVAKDCPEDPAEWLRRAETCHGSWWPDYANWLAERCGEEQAAPAELGGGGLAPICDAPGTYVYDR